MKTVLIAGAGIIGLACAWRLQQRGWSVTVFDARAAAKEASWAGAGMLAPGGEIDSDAALACMALQSLAKYPDFVCELQEESGLKIEYRRCGAIEVAMDETRSAELSRKALRQAALGILSESCRYRAWDARFYPGDALVDPRSLTTALSAACDGRGVMVHEHEPVVTIFPNGSGLRTDRREYRSDRVLVAAGAWSSLLSPELPRVYPVKGHLLRFDMEPGSLRKIVRCGHTYLLQRASGALIAGSSSEDVGYDRTLDTAIISGIHKRAAELLPQLKSLKPSDCWNGLRPAREGGPVMGRLDRTQIWMAYGHFRNGILLAPETAQTIADQFEAE